MGEPLPSGVACTPAQKNAMLDVLETRRTRRHPGGTAVMRRRAEQDSLTGKEINAFEVNALQSGALIAVQFSSKEGFGLVVSESLVKHLSGYEGLVICTLVGGIKPQADVCDCFKIEYPSDEVAESLKEYRDLPDHPSESFFHELAERIAARSSVRQLIQFIKDAATLPDEERIRKSKAARDAVMANFSTWANVHNIMLGLVKAARLAVLSSPAVGG